MKFKTAKKRNNGFTLVEMLAVTAIVVILLAVGMVAVVHYARWLRITELDNSAREIYLAAENRAVLLSAGGRLEAQVVQAGGDEVLTRQETVKGATPLAAGGDVVQADEFRYIYYDGTTVGSGDDAGSKLTDLLPQGTIDPALRKGCFYIVYEVKAGSVADVFYAEEAAELEDEGDFAQFYKDWRESSRQERLDNQKMFGYYGGEAARNGSSDALREPILEVINGEELLVRLTYEVPDPLPAGETRTPKVWLYYGGNKKYGIDLSGYNKADPGKEPGIGEYKEETKSDPLNNVTTYTLTWVLDTLKEDGQQFKNLPFKTGTGYVMDEKPGSFGGDFTVEAWIEGSTVHSTTASKTGNSLFADETHNDDTAYIENLRHLQNLDRDHSKVDGKTAAEQTGDIDCGASIFTGYEFVPIVNDKLESYCGSHEVEGADTVTHFIKGLTVTAASANGKPAGGLFATVREDSTGKQWSFQDVRLINTSVKASPGTPAGALVGEAENASFDGCWVYWEMDSQNELYGQLTDDNGAIKYQIIGSNAGGLAGELDGGSITDCLAATLVEGTNLAGGLVGQAKGEVTVNTSYADCYLTAPTAGGLLGTADGVANITNVYAAGFIDGAEKEAAGLCCKAEGNTVTASNAYSAMRYENTGINIEIEPLANGTLNNCHYLHINSSYAGTDYEKMVRPEQAGDRGFAGTMGQKFEWKERAESHPYDLRKAGLKTYDFPGLSNLPHYGDWNTEFIKPALVYFEEYKAGNTPRFYGGGDEVSLRDDAVVSLDGYAVAFRAEDLPGNSVTITFFYQTENGIVDYPSQQYTKEAASGDNKALLEVKVGDEVKFYLAPLPNKLIDSEYAADKFYQQLGFQVGGDTTTSWAAYCPHFAKTEFPLEGTTLEERDKEIEDEWRSGRAYAVRTPRHLRALSQFAAYYSAGRRYTFRQELDLDYATYTGYDWNNSWGKDRYTQEPIGRSGAAFNGVYDGGYHTIKGVRFTLPEGSSRQYAGLFGLSIDTLKNIVYLMDPDNKISVATGTGLNLYLGGLAGGNSGTIDNCAVAGANLEGKVYDSATASAGGLVGHNMGTIQNSAAEVKLLYTESSGYAHSRAGGLVGMNDSGATVTDSYAVGHVSAKVDSTSDARVCGFVGRNAGSVTGSYAAVWLESSGAGVETYGFCGEKMGSQYNTHFLNEGNFEYRTRPYNASYAIRSETKAKPIVYKDLIDGNSPLLSQGSKMELGGKAIGGNPGETTYPYPTGVTRIENGKTVYVHYGQWPAELNLGEMGVYYWEKLSLPTGELDQDGNELKREVYGVSMLAVKPDKANNGTGTVSKLSTLSNARSDGGVVVDYGYGYYHHEENKNVTFSAEGIRYTEDGKEGKLWGSQQSDGTVDQELKDLMPGYTFHSYHSFVPNPDPNVKDNFVEGTRAGLYATGTTGTPNGTVTLMGENKVAATFEVNPHFADALSISDVPSGYAVSDNNLRVSPGTEEGNPYEVRAMGQLSAINWNSTKRDTKTVIIHNTNNQQFPYLSYHANTPRKYYFKQTHDLDGEKKVYTPIAEYYDEDRYDQDNGKTAWVHGWFGGTFDGDDYVIENVNIQGQTASCTGLFGVVYNGILKNIILYSSDGTGRVSSGYTPESMKSNWYSIGALAGVAASDTKDSAVQNCSVAGYAVEITTYQMRDFDTNGRWGGSSAGGLLGISTMNLTGCSAVTDVKIIAGEGNKTGNKNLGNDNMRVGGLVGTSQGGLENCYAGGSISVENGVKFRADNHLYIGGLVGGSYMKDLRVNGKNSAIAATGNDVSNSLTNCYSYVMLPDKSKCSYLRCLYALGGVGDVEWDFNTADHGTCTITNCYYLESEVMKNYRNDTGGYNKPAVDKTDIGRYGNELVALTYKQLANTGTTTEKKVGSYTDIYAALNAGNAKDMFWPVTSTEGSFAIPGKYSYSSEPKLEGLDYPFPTILTREGGTIHVHYGNWPLSGIEREESGGAPITLNLLGTNRSEEVLSLSDGVKKPGGTWKVVEVPDDGVFITTLNVKPQGTDNATCELSVTGNHVGQTTVRVTYTDPDGRAYPLDIKVYVTATLRVAPRPSPIYVYPGSWTRVPLVLCDEQGRELTLTPELEANLKINKMEPGNPPKQVQAVSIEKDETDGTYYLVLRAAGEMPKDEAGNKDSTGLLTVAVDYRYGQDGGEEADADNYPSTLTIEMLELPVAKPGADGSTQITLPVGEKDGIKTVVTKVMVGEGEITQTTPETGATDPADPAKPEATWVGDVVTLKNYAPGDVTLTLTLETRRSEAEPTEPPTTHTVEMTVTIPEAASAGAALSELPPEEPPAEEALPEDSQTEEPPAEEALPEDSQTEEPPAEEALPEDPQTEDAPAEDSQAEDPALKTSEGSTMEPEETGEAELPEGPEPALPAEEKTDPVPEKDAGAGEDGTEQ